MLGKTIKDYLDQNGVKYSVLARKLGVAANTLSAMLNGKRKITAEEYFAICVALKVPLDHFASPEITDVKTSG